MKLTCILFVFFITTLFTYAQEGLNEKIPYDSKIKIGRLDNGLTYFIRYNKKPENRASLRLAVNAGSILEEDNQKGLAHFAEHMAFNGTEDFEKQELINYLESIGMKFGPEVNAYTSFDETVYMLEIPTDTAEIVEKGFQVLENWAHRVSFEDGEIDKERGVVIEEWRLGQGAGRRMLNKQLPVVFKNSLYAERLPIGEKEILEKFEYETLKQFYKKWYRPHLMAVIAVGDFDPEKIEKIIKDKFSKIPSGNIKNERPSFTVPDHKEILFAIATDKEATYTSVSYLHKLPRKNNLIVQDLRDEMVTSLYSSMFNQRLNEISQKPEAPFLGASTGTGSFVREKNIYSIGASVEEDSILSGFRAIMDEAERIRQFGFTETELKRAKENTLRSWERYFDERDKIESSGIASGYVSSFLSGNPSPGIEYSYDLYKKYIPGITLEEINKLTEIFITDSNNVIMISAPEKENVKIPSETELLAVINNVTSDKLTAYEDKVSDQPLITKVPEQSGISGETKREDFGLTYWTLKNGIKVILKPTDFKNDEVLFNGFSPGGNSLADDKDFISASLATSIVSQSGVSGFNLIELQKVLTGKSVSVNPYINELAEGISGSASSKDIETMFQLIYLYFTEPRLDTSSYLAYRNRIENWLKNKNVSPESAFQDTLGSILSGYHMRRLPWTMETLKKIDPDYAFNFYKQRFADASDFTFIFVGSFDIEKVKSFVQTYIGGLPTTKREETWKDVNINFPGGIIEKKVFKGIEPKSRVSIHFSGKAPWDYNQDFNMDQLIRIMNIKLRETLREDKGGTYGVGANGYLQKYPDEKYSLSISFGCSPDRVDELVGDTFKLIDSMLTVPVDTSYIHKAKEIERRSREVDIKTNGWWLSTLYNIYFNDLSFEERMIKDPERINILNSNDIMEAARRYLNKENYIKVVLYPEKTLNN